MAIDWFSWLAKTNLDSSIVYDYALSFSQNELEQDDITYFNHEFLQSMGISIAKHRLEILKLAKRESCHHQTHVSNLMVAIKSTKKRLAKCIRYLIRREEKGRGVGGAMVIVPRRSYSASRSKGMAMLKRNKKVVMMSSDHIQVQGRLLLTNGSPLVISDQRNTRVHSFSSPLIVHHRDLQRESENNELDDEEEEEEEGDDRYWSRRMEIRWDTMFQDLKPT